jgi:hypothetical protein
VVAAGGVPHHGEAEADQPERDGALHGTLGAVAGLADAGVLAGVAEADLDGLITNGKFCCTRRVRLSLTWWHRPLRLRRSALHTDAALVGASHDPDLDRLPPAQPASRWRAPLGSGLPAAGALGRARRAALAGADRPGGA